MAALAFLAVLAASAAASQASDARLLNVHELVTVDDYPLIALQNEQQGTVTALVKVDRDGLVASCKVTQSSGYPVLDEQTCAVLRARARFEPSRDRRGRAINSAFVQRLSWRLQDNLEVDPPFPRQAWTMRGTVSLDRSGRIVDCKVASTGFASQPLFCAPVLALARSQSDSAAPAAGVVAAFSITDAYFFPVAADKITMPPDVEGADKVAQQVSEIVIEPDGRISECKGIRYAGAAGPETDACVLLKNARFVAAAVDGKAVTGTVVVTAYLQKHSVT